MACSNFDVSIAESGGQTDNEVKKFIALTLYKESNTNIEKAVNSDGIHALFLRALSGKGIEEQLSIMELLSEENREVSAIYNKFLS